MRHDALTLYIDFARLMVERDRRLHREIRMTIEIKGLGANVEAARAAIRKARAATARMNDAGSTLERTANEIASVFEQHTSDLLREANTLGNSSNESGEQSQQGEHLVVKPGEAGQGTIAPQGQAAQAPRVLDSPHRLDPGARSS